MIENIKHQNELNRAMGSVKKEYLFLSCSQVEKNVLDFFMFEDVQYPFQAVDSSYAFHGEV